MLFIAIKNRSQEKTRLLISVVGVAFAILLMLVLLGIREGLITYEYR